MAARRPLGGANVHSSRLINRTDKDSHLSFNISNVTYLLILMTS